MSTQPTPSNSAGSPNRGPLDLSAILAKAGENTQTHFRKLARAGLGLLAMVYIVTMIISRLSSSEGLLTISLEESLFASYVTALVLAPVFTGLFVMGIKCALGEDIGTKDITRQMSSIIVLGLAQLIIFWMVSLGLLMLIVPGLYVLIATIFVLPLIADKKLGVFKAITLSVVTVNQYLGQFIMLFFLFFALTLLAFVTFGIALLWVVPFYYCALGLIYVELFGYGEGVFTQGRQPL